MVGQLHVPAALYLQIIVPGKKMVGVCVCVCVCVCARVCGVVWCLWNDHKVSVRWKIPSLSWNQPIAFLPYALQYCNMMYVLVMIKVTFGYISYIYTYILTISYNARFMYSTYVPVNVVKPYVPPARTYFINIFSIMTINSRYYVYWTMHHCDSWRIRDQLDVTSY